jgi:sec-independent protein translocase protein TatB
MTAAARVPVPGPQELLVIAVVALLVFGPDRLPEVARNAATWINRLRAETDRSVGELKRAAGAEGLDREWRDASRELRETRDQLRRPFAAEPGRKPVNRAAGRDGRPRWRDDDDPPPVDVEAT